MDRLRQRWLLGLGSTVEMGLDEAEGIANCSKASVKFTGIPKYSNQVTVVRN